MRRFILCITLAICITGCGGEDSVRQPQPREPAPASEVPSAISAEDARKLFVAGDLDTLANHAVSGEPEAQYYLATLYHLGRVVQRNDSKAAWWYLSAADQNHSRAQCMLGYFYVQGFGAAQDYRKARSWFFKAAEQGNPSAQAYLALLYLQGWGGERDEAEARAW